jgi:hypothetical protein
VSVQPEKENQQQETQQRHPSHLKLCVMVNGKEISESEELVAKMNQEDQHQVMLQAKEEQSQPPPPTSIQTLSKPSNLLQPRKPIQPSRPTTKRVAPKGRLRMPTFLLL